MDTSSSRMILVKDIYHSFQSLYYELALIVRDQRSKRVFGLIGLCLLCVLLVTLWSISSNSICLTVCSTFLWIDLLTLASCLVTFWVEQKKPNKIFTFGHIRCEILFVFVVTILGIFSSLFTLRECFIRFVFEQPSIESSYFILAIIATAASNLIIKFTASEKNKALAPVFTFSSSNFIQDQLARISRKLCQNVPGLSVILLPRVNAFLLFLTLASFWTILAKVCIEVYEANIMDTVCGSVLSFLLIVTLLPLCSFTGNILLQTTPTHMTSHLDKCLREASTMDGVLEFRNEHFWSLGYNNIVGSLHVRIRRDANEQVVLSHLTNRLSNLLSDLTIQVFKDEWSWQPTSRYMRTDQSALLKYNLSSSIPSSVISSPSGGNSLGTHVPALSTTASPSNAYTIDSSVNGIGNNSTHASDDTHLWLQQV